MMTIIVVPSRFTSIDTCIQLSAEDADLAEWHWSLQTKHSFANYNNKNHSLLHRIIMERKLGRPLLEDEQVDHIDRNRFNNRRDNLRIATHAQNMQNKQFTKERKDGPMYKGVWEEKKSKRWCARIGYDGKIKYLGCFTSAEDAARAYNDAAIKYHGEFAVLNEILT